MVSIDRAKKRQPSGESEHDLICQCLRGDSESFRQIYQRYQRQVRSILFRLCGESQLDDLTQEVFLRAWKGLPKMQNPERFAAWLYRIAWNIATDYRRGAAQTRSRLESLSQQTQTQTPAPDLMHLHYQDLVQRGLAHLSFDHGSVLILHDLEGLSQNQIAEILAIPAGTVKSRLSRSRLALKQFLHQQGVQL
ncbi:MAG: sigma-70 family RNA polymerase sigma factor [Aphanocapsa sp. GSE-SYN-MK-11-07L]|jgi:RNA polymerase sigma-70 factor (ECF subfamily)|nr:sigma-70 family RNA polymerase sigma factor [Aphanocapsa sp. GSE-SYN-MK-11-07L]